MSTEKELVRNTVEKLKENVELFYQQKTGEALGKFDSVLGEVSNMVGVLFSYKETHEEFNIDEDKIKSILTDAMNALEERDMILLADIIEYDFVEYVEELLGNME